MPGMKNKIRLFNNLYLQAAGILVLLLLAVLLLWFNNVNNRQASGAMAARVQFRGEYRIEDGQWQEITGQHIPATKGDVTLRGNFHMLTPDGEYVGIYSGELPVAFYINHLSLTFIEGNKAPEVMDMENPVFGDSSCGVTWSSYTI